MWAISQSRSQGTDPTNKAVDTDNFLYQTHQRPCQERGYFVSCNMLHISGAYLNSHKPPLHDKTITETMYMGIALPIRARKNLIVTCLATGTPVAGSCCWQTLRRKNTESFRWLCKSERSKTGNSFLILQSIILFKIRFVSSMVTRNLRRNLSTQCNYRAGGKYSTSFLTTTLHNKLQSTTL